MGTAQPMDGLTESYARWRSSRLGQITDTALSATEPKLEEQLLLHLHAEQVPMQARRRRSRHPEAAHY